MRPLAMLALSCLLLAGARPALAAWAQAGNSVVDNSLLTFDFVTPGGGFSSMCSDGHGGFIVAYHRDSPSTPDSIKVQRMDRDGNRLWGGASGLLVAPGEGLASSPTVLADGGGGAWVAYLNLFSGGGLPLGLYAQHLDEDGNPSIPYPGIRVGGSSLGATKQPHVAVTTGGELVAMWIGQGPGGGTDTVRVQRVSQNGALDFAAAGVVVATSTQAGNDIIAQAIVADGAGLVAVWTEETNSTGPDRLRASRVNGSGVPQWGTQGTTVFEDPDYAVIFADAFWDAVDGLTVAFSATEVDDGDEHLFATRLEPSGTVDAAWGSTSNAEELAASGVDAGVRRSVRIVPDGADGCIVGWVDRRNDAVVGPGGVPYRGDIRGQRLNASGTKQWAFSGVAVNTSENEQRELTMIPDGTGGAYFAYETVPRNDSPGAFTADVQVTRVNAAGTVLWHTFHSGATQPPSSDGDQGEVMLAQGPGGDVTFAWVTPAGIFANHREGDGTLYSPSLTVLLPAGGEFYGTMQGIPVTWASNAGGNVRIEYTINNGTPVLITSNTADDGAYTWYAPVLNSNQVRVRVSSVDLPALADLSNGFISICPTVNAPYTIGGPVTTPRDVESADFDEDGILDLAVAVSGGVAILHGNGTGGVGNATFGAAAVYATPAAANRVAIGDFDEDGILDLAVTHASGLMTFRGDGTAGVGDGTFATGVAVAGIGRCVGIVAADLDNDGVLDLAAADSVNNRVAIFLGNSSSAGDGTGAFGSPSLEVVGTAPTGIAAADLDLDGDLDLVTSNYAGGSISKLTNTGTNGFGTGDFGTSSRTTFAGAHAVVLHDVDDDGDPDAIVANAAGISVHLNTLAGGIATLEANTDYVSGLPMADLVVADPSRNGIEDVAGASLIGAMEVFFGDGSSLVGDGTFTIGGGLATTGTTPSAITANDFNKDGRIDFAIANLATNNLTMFTGGCASTVSTPPVVTSPNGGEILLPQTFHTITWTKGTTTTSVDVEVSRDAGANWERIATDVVGTSLVWKVALPATTQARVRVLAHGHPHLADASNANFTICPALSNSGPVITTAAGGPQDAVTGDFNEDGIQDLVHTVTGGIAFKRGLGSGGVGNGTFATDVSFSAGGDGRNLVAADFNEDGILDLAVTRAGGVAMMWGDGPGGVGNGTFGLKTTVPAGGDPTGIAVGDFNEDGIQDLAVSNPATDSVFVLIGAGTGGVGTGGIASHQRIHAGDLPGRIVTGDFNGDGILDLAVASASAGSPGVQVMLGTGSGGTGNGGFTTGTRFATPSAAADVATGDFNEDGITDLAIAGNFRLWTMRGNGAGGVGNGTFAAAVEIDNFATFQRVAVADFNRDGRADLLASLSSISPVGSVRLYYGKGAGESGNGTFTEPESYSTGNGLGPIALSDYDEDGGLDAMVGAPASSRYLRLLGGCGGESATIAVTTPNGNEAWAFGDQRTISWTTGPTVVAVDVELSRDGGANYETVARKLTANSFVLDVAGPATLEARVRVRDAANANVQDASDADFRIYPTLLDAPTSGLPTTVAFSAPSPNPARGPVAFALSLPEERHVTVDLFDMQGRHVRSLARGAFGAGQHRLTWDGRDEGGAGAAAGMYFARVRAGSFEATRHVVRVK